MQPEISVKGLSYSPFMYADHCWPFEFAATKHMQVEDAISNFPNFKTVQTLKMQVLSVML
jgi:hypothetical protein